MSAGREIIVLHGLAMNKLWMAGVSAALKKAGYKVHSISYPSRSESFDKIVDEHLKPVIDGIQTPKVDFVGHSLGGLLIRLYAAKYGNSRIGRVVMMGTPNHGSEVADFLHDWPAFKNLFGYSGQNLGTHDTSLDKLPPVDFECGVIAASSHLQLPTGYVAGIPRPNDGVVSVASTKVEGMKDHTVISAEHSQMVWSPKAWKLTVKFLETGSFA